MVDALASGASVLRDVEVRVFSRVPNEKEVMLASFSYAWIKSLTNLVLYSINYINAMRTIRRPPSQAARQV